MSYNGMQTIGISGQPIGAAVSGGNTTTVTGTWTNTFGETTYIWGINAQMDLGLTVVPGNSLFNGKGNAIGMPSGTAADINDYLKNCADLSIYFQRGSDGTVLLGKGSDHYDNYPGMLWENPCFFPIPFKVGAGDSVTLISTATNGYQKEVGGTFYFSATAALYLTVGSTGNTSIPNF